jgi:hypothetical protein
LADSHNVVDVLIVSVTPASPDTLALLPEALVKV